MTLYIRRDSNPVVYEDDWAFSDGESGSAAAPRRYAASGVAAAAHSHAHARAGSGSTYSSHGSPIYEYVPRQRTWSGHTGGGGSGSGSYEERPDLTAAALPGRNSHRNRFHAPPQHQQHQHRDGDWPASPASHRAAARHGFDGHSSGGGGGPGSFVGSRRGSTLSSMEEGREARENREHKERDREHDRLTQQRARMRQILRREIKAYPKRLQTYLWPVVQSAQAMDRAVEVFTKLDQDARYLSQSAGVLLESLATVGDGRGDGTGLGDNDDGEEEDVDGGEDDGDEDEANDDSPHDSTESTDTSAIETDDDDDASDADGYGFSRRSHRGSIGSARARRIRAHRRSSAASNGTPSASSPTTPSSSSFMQWSAFRPYALNRNSDAVSDRCKSFLALTQIIGVTLLASLGVSEPPAEESDEPRETGSVAGRRRRGSSQASSSSVPLTTKGLLAALRREMRPRDYRGLFRASARVLLLPDTRARRHAEDMGLEALERQLLLGPAALATKRTGPNSSSKSKVKPGTSGATAAVITTAIVTCLTYGTSGSSYGTITQYVVDLVRVPRDDKDSDSDSESESDVDIGKDKTHRLRPIRIAPVAAMPGVPKELLRRLVRSSAPARRTVLRVETAAAESLRLRWVALPDGTPAVPHVGVAAPSLARPPLSAAFCAALATDAAPLRGPGRKADRGVSAASSSPTHVGATVPALLAWMHVRSAYLTDVQVDHAGPSAAAKKTAVRGPSVVQWRRGPTAVPHEGREPCVVVLHPDAAWTTAPMVLVDEQQAKRRG